MAAALLSQRALPLRCAVPPAPFPRGAEDKTRAAGTHGFNSEKFGGNREVLRAKATVRSFWPLQIAPKVARSPLSGRENSLVDTSDSFTENSDSRAATETSFITKFVNFVLVPSIALACIFSSIDPAEARLSGVNRPELLPKGKFVKVIDVAGFLSPGQESRISQKLDEIEYETGFKLRVLAQNYPETPGLAIKDYWGVDDDTIVFVADPSLGNILNFNVGASVDLSVPRSFWSRVAGKYGNVFYWKENGEDASIEAAVDAIDACLKEPQGPRKCADVK